MEKKIISDEQIKKMLNDVNKPIAIANFPYPLNSLDDRTFEILTYTIFKQRILKKDLKLIKRFDDILLMQGVGEKGIDCVLTQNNKFAAFIQCKKYSRNLSDTQILLELVKFSIHFFLNKKSYDTSKKFTYYIATSTGFTNKALNLPEILINENSLKSIDIKSYIIQNLKKYQEFNHLSADALENDIYNIINNFSYELIIPSDYNIWINKFPEVVNTFFEIKKVTDNSLIKQSTEEIIEKIESLSKEGSIISIEKFLVQYQKALIEKLNTINFIGFDLNKYRQKPTDISLIDLFVKPLFYHTIDAIGINQKIEKTRKTDLTISDILKSEKNLIILGDPGAGKSLLVKYLIIQILDKKDNSLKLNQYLRHIPFRIELRKYNEVRGSKSITEYLSDIITKEMQINISDNLINDLLKTRDSIIFFDGLDEIFDISHKVKIKEMIESFSSSFSKSKCIVTSRFIGYHDIKFNPNKFDEFAIQKFNKQQILDLVTKFYSTQILNLEKRKIYINQCLSQIEKDIDVELKSNPLIMTLILILSSNNIIIPDSKLEIYEACTKTLVETIDLREKELKFEIPVKHKRLTFAHLAYWQYKELSNNQIINYNKTIKSLSDFLIIKDEIKEYVEAEEKAKKFLEYAEKRSIYFEDNFTHKTFLEYYTADYLYINYFTKASDLARKSVISIITEYLPNPFWYIVFELLLMRVDNEQADEELLDEIINHQIDSQSLNVFYFLITNLAKLNNISDSVVYEVLKKTIILYIKVEKNFNKERRSDIGEDDLISKIYSILENNNIRIILQSVINDLEKEIKNKRDLTEFYILYYEIGSFNRKVNHPLSINNIRKVEELAKQNLHLYNLSEVALHILQKDYLKDIIFNQIEYFGINSLFKDQHYHFRTNMSRIDTFNIFLMKSIDFSDYINFKKFYDKIVESGITQKYILQHLSRNRIFFFYKRENLEKLIRFFLLSDDSGIDEIIMLMFKNNNMRKEIKENYKIFRSSNKNKKLKILDNIFLK